MLLDILQDKVFQQFLLIIGGFVLLIVVIYSIFNYFIHKQASKKVEAESISTETKEDNEVEEPKKEILSKENVEITEENDITEKDNLDKQEEKITLVEPEVIKVIDDDIEIDEDLDEDLFKKANKSEDNIIDMNQISSEEPVKEEPKKEEPELGKYHVLYRKSDHKWYIKREGSSRIIRVLDTQKEAIAYATIKAINQDTSLVIHKMDGKIRKQNY